MGGRRERINEIDVMGGRPLCKLVTISLFHPKSVCFAINFITGDSIKIMCMHSSAMTSSKPVRIFQSSDTSGFSSLDYSCSIKY